jgi:hypothetical protein
MDSRARDDRYNVRYWPKQTWASAPHMSAFGGKADINFDGSNVILAWRES